MGGLEKLAISSLNLKNMGRFEAPTQACSSYALTGIRVCVDRDLPLPTLKSDPSRICFCSSFDYRR